MDNQETFFVWFYSVVDLVKDKFPLWKGNIGRSIALSMYKDGYSVQQSAGMIESVIGPNAMFSEEVTE